MMKFLIGAMFCGAGALFPFLLIEDDMEVSAAVAEIVKERD